MAKKIVRYLLEGNGSVPLFILDGGHFMINNEFIGVTVDENSRHVPSTVVRLTKLQLIEWVTSHHKNNSNEFLNDIDGKPFTSKYIEETVNAFLEKNGLHNYE